MNFIFGPGVCGCDLKTDMETTVPNSRQIMAPSRLIALLQQFRTIPVSRRAQRKMRTQPEHALCHGKQGMLCLTF